MPLFELSMGFDDFLLVILPANQSRKADFWMVLYVVPPVNLPFDSPQLDLSSLTVFAGSGRSVQATWYPCPRAMES
jgi:hypothetical protein